VSTFGTTFVLVSDVIQEIPGLRFGNPPERVIHHATVRRGNKEYLVMASGTSNQLYLNEVERRRATFKLKRIEDDMEYNELVEFLKAAGVFNAGGPKKHAN